MARYFRDISIHLGSNQTLPNNKSVKDFNRTTHTVQDIFWYKMPSRFSFGNILKLNIDICGVGEEERDPIDFGGYVSYTYTGLNFEEYFEISQNKRNRIILSILKNILSRINEENVKNKDLLLSYVKEIEESNFEYKQVSEKLSKWHKTRKIRAIIEYHINDEGQNAYLSIVNRNDDELIRTHLLKNELYEFSFCLFKTKWKEDVFKIIKRDGILFKEFKVNIE